MNLLARAVRASVRVLDRLPPGSAAPKLYWRYRHLVEGKDWIRGYFESRHDPRRAALIEHVLPIPGASRCLEVGCNAGANLAVLATKRPDWEVVGVDINRQAIDMGRRMFAALQIDNVRLEHADAEHLSWLESDAVDVTFTDAALMYVPPTKLHRVLDELARITSLRLLLNEFLVDGRSARLGGYWAHDYATWARQQGYSVRIHSSPRAGAGGFWNEYGQLVEVSLA